MAGPLQLPPAGEWRAAESGRQSIRIEFAVPQPLSRIRLTFRETARERTQEFLLSCHTIGDLRSREIVRQQFTFSPQGATVETEEYLLSGMFVALELQITPDISGGPSVASLAELRLG